MYHSRSQILKANWSDYSELQLIGDLRGAEFSAHPFLLNLSSDPAGETIALQAAREEGDTDDGERWVRVRDVEDTEHWASHTNIFNREGEHRQQDGEFDNGQTWLHTWDVAETQVWSRTTLEEDVSDLTWWTRHTLYYNDADELHRQTGVKDNHDRWEHVWGLDGTAAWHRQTRLTDFADTRDRFEQIQTFDEAGNLLSTTYVDDIA